MLMVKCGIPLVLLKEKIYSRYSLSYSFSVVDNLLLHKETFFHPLMRIFAFIQQDDSEFLFQFSSGIKVLFLFKKHM